MLVSPSLRSGLLRRLGGDRAGGALSVAVFIEAPLISVAFYIWFIAVSRGWVMQDFMAVRTAAQHVLHGASPYPPPDAAIIAGATRLVYPPLIAYLFVPFAVLPYSIAAALYLCLLVGSIPASLFVLGVRDWRCYGLPLVWFPAVSSFGVGAIGPILILLVALCWRYRDRVFLVASLVAITVTLKLFLWPLWIWLIATRRWRAAALSAVLTGVAFLLPFAALGWDVLHRYPTVLRAVNDLFGPRSFSSNALFEALGVSTAAAQAGVAVLGLLLSLSILRLGRSGDGDRHSIVVAVAASLLLSPIVWMHYYILLLIPIALAKPRLAPIWFLPMLFWSIPKLEAEGDLKRLLIGLAITLATTIVSIRAVHPRAELVPVTAGS
jgi:alpha-1,2-mannosyltransferase